MSTGATVGIVGGSGMLGHAIATGWLSSGAVSPDRLWISNRSGSRAGFEDWPDVTVTADSQALADACDVILLSVPPALAGGIGISAPDRLVASVMAGVTLDRIAALTGTTRVVRAMSSPAAALRLAYSPFAASGATEDDRTMIRHLLSAIGTTDEVPDEAQIDLFTAMTGPVPGFVAFFAACMQGYATDRGVAPEVAERAVRQLFLSAGQMMADGPAPDTHVRQMIDYAGTTAAGLLAMQETDIAEAIAKGLDAAVARTRGIAG
ncbi:pyrroline-5-carboxylate reductase [Oceanicola sp. 22II-s10i]|uniref:pyrroline-5-carboxylate reductase family protein n=1 Tax=Oceanicola sp. 22II-s10i TaxID=1317116 RepID=UPI000B523EED|nr:pyrroline-5-carboxylate reductase dimerization domain-containing protein [Oceanicola sp. 22II-s10i]OWU85269.1 pyrroline-5-carboxylate reductase [Oceanicola sp. 22II-s10i]